MNITFMIEDSTDPDGMPQSAFCGFLSRSSPFAYVLFIVYLKYSKTCLKIGFQDRLLLNAGQKYCRMLQDFEQIW